MTIPIPHQHFEGLIAAPHSPMHPDGTIAASVVARQAAHLARVGVSGAFVCGTTGESASLTLDERRELVTAWIAAAPAGFRIIVNVGNASQADAIVLARHAAASGAWGIAAALPSFFRPRSAEAAARWLQPIAAAAPLPFYYYHIPVLTGCPLPCCEVIAAARALMPSLAGVKFTSEDLHDFARTRLLDPRLEMAFGRDEILLAGLAMGARAAVGSTYNFAAPIYLAVMAATAAGDLVEARRHQERATTLVALLERHGGLAAGKAMMALIGIDCGPVRSPLASLDAAATAALATDIAAAGLADALPGFAHALAARS